VSQRRPADEPPVIPALVRFDAGERAFAFRSGTRVVYSDTDLGPIIERFSSEVARRTGIRLEPMARTAGPGEPSVRIEHARGDELGALPTPEGVSPTGDPPPDERHSIAIDAGHVVVRAAEPIGVARGLTTLVQLLSTTSPTHTGEVVLPGAQILDAPRYAWRGLSLDVARAWFTPHEVRRVIDLLALYKLNVLHLHLTDDQSWRLPMQRSVESPGFDTAFYSAEDLRTLTDYAADRFVTVVPEVDTPGHTSALMRMHPALDTGRNVIEVELGGGKTRRAAWLDPESPATFELIEQVLAGVAAIFPSQYLHIGADEPFGMPHEPYASYVRRLRAVVRSIGRRPLGWQESARAGLGPDDVIQYWIDDIGLPPDLPPMLRQILEANVSMSPRDIEIAVAAPVPVILSPVSHCYLDVPYAEPSADPTQTKRQRRVGLRAFYPARTVAEAFDWEPAEALRPAGPAQVGGVEAAIWAETISDFEDLCFLLLPRLAGLAEKAWSNPQTATWSDHRARLTRHGHLWTQDDLTYFRTSMVDWL